MGTYAERITVPASVVAPAPTSIPLMTAAAVPVAAVTAWFATVSQDHGNIQAGQTVLIHGGPGGTGMFAVQFARWRGARAFATASSGNMEFLRSLGVQEPIDYRTRQMEEVARDLDAVIDLVGVEAQTRSFPLLRRGGVLTSIVSPPHSRLADPYSLRRGTSD